MGRKSKYESSVKPYLKEINKKIREGVTEYEIAKSLGISEVTLNNYKKKHPELVEALQTCKGSEVLQRLINAGIESACGYYKEIEHTTIVLDKDGNPKKQKSVDKVWYPPNPSLNQFYVKNFGKEEGFVSDPLDYQLRKSKAELDEAIAKGKNWDVDFGEGGK